MGKPRLVRQLFGLARSCQGSVDLLFHDDQVVGFLFLFGQAQPPCDSGGPIGKPRLVRQFFGLARRCHGSVDLFFHDHQVVSAGASPPRMPCPAGLAS
jgi:hypothetical protein